MAKLASLILVVVFLVACMPFATEPVFLEYPQTGKIAQCGPYGYGVYTATAAALREEKCIGDFQRQGYVRLSGKSAQRK